MPRNANYKVSVKNPPAGYKFEESYDLKEAGLVITTMSSVIDNPDKNWPDAVYKAGDIMMDLEVTTVDGRTLKLSEILKTKKMVLLNFFFTTCGPCASEFPYMNSSYEKYKDDIEIIAINPYPTDTENMVKLYASDYELQFPVAKVPTSWASRFPIGGYPTNMIIDRYGMIALVEVGGIVSETPFNIMFDYFTKDEYVQKIVNDIEEITPTEVPDIDMPSSEEIGAAINSGDITIEYFPEDNEMSWPFVITSVTALAFLDRNVISLSEHRINGYLLALDNAFLRGLAACVYVNRLGNLYLNSSLSSREANTEAFPWGISVKRVRHLSAACVLNENVHGILNADIITENALITDIAVVSLGVEVKLLKLLIALHYECKRIALGIFLTVNTGIELGYAALLCILSAVELKIAERKNALRISAEPEVNKVKVVSCLMNHKTAAVSLISVPTAEVIRAVRGVKQPLEVNLSDLAYSVVHYKLTNLGVVRRIAVIEGNAKLFARSVNAVDYLLALVLINGHGLL